MSFMDAFLDELNKIAATNEAANVGSQYGFSTERKTVIPKINSAESTGGFMKLKQPVRPSFLSRNRTGNLVGASRSR